MTVNVCGSIAAAMTLKPKRHRAPVTGPQPPPGGGMRPKSWKVVGAVIGIPAESPLDKVRWTKRTIGWGTQGPYDGLLFVGPIAGYVGLLRKSKKEPFTAKFPATRGGGLKLNDRVWKALIRAYWKGEPDKDVLNREVPCFVKDEAYLSGSVLSLTRTIWPISIEKTTELWGIQFCPGIKKRNKDPGKRTFIYELSALLREIKVKPRDLVRMKRCIQPAGALAVSAGWRCWVVAGVRREGNAKEIIKEWVSEIPEDYRAFRRVFCAGDFVGED